MGDRISLRSSTWRMGYKGTHRCSLMAGHRGSHQCSASHCDLRWDEAPHERWGSSRSAATEGDSRGS